MPAPRLSLRQIPWRDKTMRNTLTIATPVAALLALAGQLFAGGFFLQLGNPEASAEARKNNAVVTIKATGCHDPATAQLTATALGMVNGHRQSIPLTITKLRSWHVRHRTTVAQGGQVGDRAGRQEW